MKNINKICLAIVLLASFHSSLGIAEPAFTAIVFEHDLPQEDLHLKQKNRDEQEFKMVWLTMKIGSVIAFAISTLQIGTPDTYRRAERFAPALFIGADLAKLVKSGIIDRLYR